MDRLEAMSLLIAVVETGSFSGAGRQLGVPLPTVSRKIADLEAHLGARLLVRSTRRSSLTEAGARYVAACRRILEEVGDAERAAAGELTTARGELVVTAPVAFGRLRVLPIVTDFLATYPDIQVRLVLSDRNLHLIDDHIDVAVRIGALADSNLTATRVGAIRRVICASPAFLAGRRLPQKRTDLEGLPAITFEGPGPRSEGIPGLRSRLTVNTAEAAVDAAIAGVGIAHVLSYQAAAAVQEGKLRLLSKAEGDAPIPVSLVHAGRSPLPLKTRRFLEHAVPRLRASLRG